jgi:putative multiple sugar transport system permease protein
LNGKTISPFPEEFTRLFNSYVLRSREASLAAGIVVALLVSGYMAFAWTRKRRKGYEAESLPRLALKLAVISALVIAVSHLLGQDKGIPVILILLVLVVFAYGYYTQNTVPGRHLYAMGGSEKAAKLSGINTDRTLFIAYANMGFLAAVAALVCVARFNSAAPSAGNNYELDAIGACFIGGASAYGGTGKVGGAVMGAIFMGVLNNGMSILGVDQNWTRAVKGLVLLAAVVFDVLRKKGSQSA